MSPMSSKIFDVVSRRSNGTQILCRVRDFGVAHPDCMARCSDWRGLDVKLDVEVFDCMVCPTFAHR